MPTQYKTFRVFISSTFADMREERKILQKEVFPKLEKYCESKGARFQAVDLRWGVTEASQLEQKTIDICLGEVKRCQKISPKPNFLILLGDRYGWQPIPSKIPHFEMEEILLNVTAEEKDLLNRWYRLDENAIPAEFILQPREGEDIEYTIWENTEKILREIFRKSVTNLDFSIEQMNKYFCSATHLEILNGALNPPKDIDNPEKHVFAYSRNIIELPKNKDASDYLDFDGEKPDEYCKKQIKNLKSELKQKLGSHYIEYSAMWENNQSRIDNTLEFVKNVYNNLLVVIDSQISNAILMDCIEQDKYAHEKFKNKLTLHFYGRGNVLEIINDYINNKREDRPFLLIGESGTGKSSVMAKAIQNTEIENPNSAIFYRFAGITNRTTSLHTMMFDLCKQIADVYNEDWANLDKTDLNWEDFIENKKPIITDNLLKLSNLFHKCLSLAKDNKPLCLFIDGLDQLSNDDVEKISYFISENLNSNVRIIISSLPNAEVFFNTRVIRNLEVLPIIEANIILDKWLNAINRQLTMGQKDEILLKFKKTGKPIYLKLAFEQAKSWKSYTYGFFLKDDVTELINDLINKLEAVHGKDFVKAIISYILCGRYRGLTEKEILEILVFDANFWKKIFLPSTHPLHREEIQEVKKIPIILWSRFVLDFDSYLSYNEAGGDSVITFFHRQFFEVLADRYNLTENNRSKEIHLILAKYFQNIVNEKRKILEYPWQLMKAGEFIALSKCIMQIDIFNPLFSENKTDLHNYWTQIEKESKIKLSELGHELVNQLIDFNEYEQELFSKNMNEFLSERKLYHISIIYLENIGIHYQYNIHKDSEIKKLIEILEKNLYLYIYIGYLDVAKDTCEEILCLKILSPTFLKKMNRLYKDELDNEPFITRKVMALFLSFYAMFFLKINKINLDYSLASFSEQMSSIYLKKGQIDNASKWSLFQYKLNTNTKHKTKHLFGLGIKMVYKLILSITHNKEDASFFISQHPMFRKFAEKKIVSYFAIAKFHLNNKKYKKALKFANKSKDLASTHLLSLQYIDCIGLIAKVLFESGEYKKSLTYYGEQRKLYQAGHNECTIKIIELHKNLAKVYDKLDSSELAIEFVEKNIKIFRQLGYVEELKEALDTIIDLSNKISDKARVVIYKEERAEIDLRLKEHVKSENYVKKGNFDVTIIEKNIDFGLAEQYFINEKYDEAIAVITWLKDSLKVYSPPDNKRTVIEDTIMPYVKKSGFVIGLLFGIFHLLSFYLLKLLNESSNLLSNNSARLLITIIVVAVLSLLAYAIKKGNYSTRSTLLSYSLVLTFAMCFLGYNYGSSVVLILFVALFLLVFIYLFSYLMIKIIIYSVSKIIASHKERRSTNTKKVIYSVKIYPHFQKILMNCIRVEGNIYKERECYDKAYEKFIELEKISEEVGDTNCLLESYFEQLTYQLNEKLADLSHKTAAKLVVLLDKVEIFNYMGLTKLNDNLYYSYWILEHYYSRIGDNGLSISYGVKKENIQKIRNKN
jgi:hypothetical protein